ncbi:DNA polymerase III subunit delta [Actibacterium lipolyticum]|uniref:DNA-directed DNA polymerase n=1 Tax=Actibacterium lipolyticum TaxID=1524263 RepID=A0A238KVY8_9RHOB|nr:DNA polymerase III subunit delta [Actibacterium lipolyticum]SMX46352.1 DNA polymerase III subunit delta [Actibacterium lipolyticum]
MKLSGRDANRYFAKPDPRRTGLLIYGQDAMRVALKRQEVIAALVGPQGEEEMRLTRIPASDLRSDPAQLLDALKSQGFFPGPRVAFVEEAGDGLAPTIKTALSEWQEGDAQLVVTAKQLNARSALRKLFEAHPNAYAIGIYDDPPSREDIEAELQKHRLTADNDAMTDLTNLSRMLDPGDFRQTIEKLSLYKFSDPSPVTGEDILACAPTSTEAALDDVLNIVAEARTTEIGPIMRKLESQGVQPVGLCIGATRHFRTLHTAACDPGGPSSGISRMRPPVFGPRRDRMVRQASKWGVYRLEQALTILTDTDLQLRSTQKAPTMALMERALIRLAMLGSR